MKKTGNLLERIADPDNLRLAAWKAAKGKRHAAEVLEYFSTMETRIPVLREQILSGAVQVGNYRFFKVYEPKERQICASVFPEQVLHHALMNLCHDRFEKAQIFDSYASRKNKGTYAALARAKYFSARYEWYLKLDVRKFFESIHHEVLMNQLSNLFKEPDLLGIFEKIIDSYHARPFRGLPIGNLTSQYFANHYLSPLDHTVKERLRVKAYVRYMDDMVLWANEKDRLKRVLDTMNQHVEQDLACTLKPVQLNRTACGLPFVGYHLFPHHVRLLQKSKTRLIRKMRITDENYRSGLWPDTQCQRRALPLLAFAAHSNADILRKNILLWLEGQSP